VTATDAEFDERGGSLYEERTDLAWSRTGIALVGAVAILARRVWQGSATPTDALIVALLGVAGLGWAIGVLGWRLTHAGSDDPGPRQPRELLAVVAGTVALATAGLVFAFADT
jgi:uncharacterized membrane protein YidH (DUF202 family)